MLFICAIFRFRTAPDNALDCEGARRKWMETTRKNIKFKLFERPATTFGVPVAISRFPGPSSSTNGEHTFSELAQSSMEILTDSKASVAAAALRLIAI